MKITAAMMTSPIDQDDARRPTSPGCWRTCHSEVGKVATTWVKIRIDMPLPMPRSVISSPSHMITAVPAVMVTTMIRKVEVPSLCSSVRVQPWSRLPERASATMPVACRSARPSVR